MLDRHLPSETLAKISPGSPTNFTAKTFGTKNQSKSNKPVSTTHKSHEHVFVLTKLWIQNFGWLKPNYIRIYMYYISYNTYICILNIYIYHIYIYIYYTYLIISADEQSTIFDGQVPIRLMASLTSLHY